jgi:hypothetical protein
MCGRRSRWLHVGSKAAVELHAVDKRTTTEPVTIDAVLAAAVQGVRAATIATKAREFVHIPAGAHADDCGRELLPATGAATIATAVAEVGAIGALAAELIDESASANVPVSDPGARWAAHIHDAATMAAVGTSVNVDRCVVVRVVVVRVVTVRVVAVRNVNVVAVRDVNVVAVRDVEVVAVRMMRVGDMPVAATAATAASPLGLSGLIGLSGDLEVVGANFILKILADRHSGGEQHEAERQQRDHGELHCENFVVGR